MVKRKRRRSIISGKEESTFKVPWIFLSHSGFQKKFTRRLYLELVHAKHHPFFDEDACMSLPKGLHYPLRILQACQSSKMGIILLSHQYVESLWPMLELQHLAFHDHSHPGPRLLYPLFFKLSPADLLSTDNLARWQHTWSIKGPEWHNKVQKLQASISSQGSQFDIHMDVSLWPKALEMLAYRSGEVRDRYQNNDAYVEAIISHVCYILPPPQHYFLGNDIEGADHMQEDIDKLFQQQAARGADGVNVLGVHGIGGSGKSTLCVNMANFYNKDFPGRSCWLELPSKMDNKQQLVEAIKAVLPALALTSTKSLKAIRNLEEALAHLQEGLRQNKVFLALDNVWEWPVDSFSSARKIILMDYMPGSKIMVTSRSKLVLDGLLQRRMEMNRQEDMQGPPMVVHVPSITIAEATEALAYHSLHSNYIPLEDLRSLALSCFFEEQCHPLLLKVMGAKLRRQGRLYYNAEDWRDVISRLQDYGLQHDQDEDNVLEVLQTSFRVVPSKLKILFTDLVTCMGARYTKLWEQCAWLSLLYTDKRYTAHDIRVQLLDLEYYGLLEIRKDIHFEDRVRIHDLYKRVAEREHTLCPDANGRYLFQGNLSSLSVYERTSSKFMIANNFEAGTGTLKSLRSCLKLEILVLDLVWHPGPPLARLSVQNMKFLRMLYLSNCSDLEKIGGWHGAPNLVHAYLAQSSTLQNVGRMGCLFKLEELVLTNFDKFRRLEFRGGGEFVSLGQQPKLLHLDLSCNHNLVDVGPIASFTALQKLSLRQCSSLRQIRTIMHCSNLSVLDLSECYELQTFPNNTHLSRLRTLLLCHCVNLKSMEGSVCALIALEKLDLRGCRSLESIPNLSELANLRNLIANGCSSLKEVKLGLSALTSLQALDLGGCTMLGEYKFDDRSSLNALELFGLPNTRQQMQHQNDLAFEPTADTDFFQAHNNDFTSEPTADRDLLQALAPLLLSSRSFDAFLNLRELAIEVAPTSCKNLALLDVSGLASVTHLSLILCTSLKEISCLNALVNLQSLRLDGCSSLKEITGLGALGKLTSLSLKGCTSLKELSGLDRLVNLQSLRMESCTSLKELSGLHALTVLESLKIVCGNEESHSSMKQILGLGASLTKLKVIEIQACPLLTDLSTLGHITSLEEITFRQCPSLEAIADVDGLTKLKNLSLLDGTPDRIFPVFPKGLVLLHLDGCTSLIPLAPLPASLRTLYLCENSSLPDVSPSNSWTALDVPSLENCVDVLQCFQNRAFTCIFTG